MKIIDRKFLPSKTTSVHAATIEWWKDHFVYAWFGGTQEGAPDVGIYIYNLNNKGETIAIGKQDQYPRWNPILFAHEGHLYLFEKIGMFCDRWQTVIHDITEWHPKIDDMTVFKSSQFLPCGLNGPVKLRPIISSIRPNIHQTIFCGSSFETFVDWSSYIEEYVIEDHKWINIGRSNPLAVKDKVFYTDAWSGMKRLSMGIIQPTIWEENGKFKAFFRSSHGLNKIYYSEMASMCDQLELRWSEPVPTNIINNNSGVSAIYLKDNLYLAFNNSDRYRYPLEVRKIKQKDNAEFEIGGKEDTLLIGDKTEEDFVTEFSYPYMISNDGKLELVYTHGRTIIEHVTMTVD